MVICDEPLFLFIHVPKAAGTSIAGAFAHVDLMRLAKQYKDPAARQAWIEAKELPVAVLDLPIHVTAEKVRETLGKDQFESLFRFAVVRNPWDMELSWYTYNVKRNPRPTTNRSSVMRISTTTSAGISMNTAIYSHPVRKPNICKANTTNSLLIEFCAMKI